jgi:hypothetical protein
MKAVKSFFLVATFGALLAGCEVSHTESDKPGIFGGNKHEETTTVKNPVTGDTSTTHTEQKTN